MVFQSSSLVGKVVIVTGSSSGIGQGIAVAFAENKAKVVITGRNVAALEETQKMCVAAGASDESLLSVCGDITKEQFRAELVAKTLKAFGKIDILINNAATIIFRSFTNDSNDKLMEAYNSIFDVNLTGVVDLTKKCVEHIIQSKGSIINISSVAGQKAVGQTIFYSMSKSALDMFTKGLANELGPKSVRVNGISPGAIDSKMFRYSVSEMATQANITEEATLKMIREMSVLNLIGKACDIANLALFLSSEEANFITGSIMVADGGWLVK